MTEFEEKLIEDLILGMKKRINELTEELAKVNNILDIYKENLSYA